MCERNFVKPLSRVGKCDFNDVGAKGASLGEMKAAGIPVPDGFAILTAAYRAYVQSNEIQKEIDRMIADIHPDQYDDLEAAEKKISALFEKHRLTEEILGEITEAYKELGLCPVAVRSSSTVEDLPGMSFAGQYDTFINVTGVEDICDAIRKCWASLWNSRAISYRVKHQISQEQIAQGVIVQKLVNGEKAGILFTANPLNGRRDQMLINASWGLGEAVVSSLVSPDQWVVEKDNGNIIEAVIPTKKAMTIITSKGITTAEVPEELQTKATLDQEEIHKLIEIGKKTEDDFRTYQDIEWVFENGKPFIVQSRPITTLFPIPENRTGLKKDLRIYLNMNLVDQGLSEPFTPMGADIWSMYLKHMTYNMSEYITTEGRVFADPTDRLRTKKAWKNVAFYFSSRDPMATKALLQWLEKNEKVILSKGKSPKMTFEEIKTFSGVAGHWLYSEVFPVKARKKMMRTGEAAFNLYKTKAKALNGFEQKLQFIQETVKDNAILTMAQAFYALPAMMAVSKAEKLLKLWVCNVKELEIVRRSSQYNPTTEMGMELLRIAERLEKRNIKPSSEVHEIKNFLEKYGHRADVEIDAGNPRWREDPTYMIDLIASYMAQGNSEEKLQKFNQGIKESEEAAKRIVAEVYQKKGKLKAVRIKRLLYLNQELMGLRELPKFELARGIALVRDVLQSMGNDLVLKEKLNKADDIFYVTINDIKSDCDLHAIATVNRVKYKQYLSRLVTPRLISSTGESVYVSAEEVGPDTLAGLPVSPGIYKGKVKIVYTPKQAELNPGEVLVAQCTNPAWTPLFLNAGAIIMETGGTLSHGAVVAREYGVPAVAGVNGATSRLKNGQTVCVNGESGQINIIE